MRFLFLSYVNTPEFKRPEDWIRRLAGYFGVLEALGEQHTVMTIEQIDYQGEYLWKGVHFYFENYGPGKLLFPTRLHRLVQRLQPDIVIVHGLCFPLQVIQLRLVLGSKVPILLQDHANKLPAGWKRGLYRMADRCTDAYLFTSRLMAAGWLAAGIIKREDKIKEAMVGSSVLKRVDKEAARYRTGCSGDPLFVWAGRLNENKDPFTAVEAFLSFAAWHPDARLYMIYQTAEMQDELRACLAESPFAASVVLAGKVEHTEMAHWFSAADFVLSTSHAEAFGLAVVEAMSCGCIPIVSDIPAYRKLTNEGSCGLLFKTGSAEDLLRALRQAMDLPRVREVEKLDRQFTEHLTFKAIADQLGSSL